MRTKKILFFSMLVCFLMTVPLALAHTDSLAVLETIPDGVLSADWVETGASNWKGQNASGVWSYNCTSTGVNWTINESNNFYQCFKTYDFKGTDAETGVGDIIAYKSVTEWYGVLYYLDHNNSGKPKLYIVWYNNTAFSYWNSTTDVYGTNRSNATDYSAGCEVDYLSAFCRVKSVCRYEGTANCFLKWKIWDPSGDEGLWWIDTLVDIPWASYHQGLVTDNTWDLDDQQTLFNKIIFSDTRVDYGPEPVGVQYIDCPTYTADYFFNLLMNFSGADDYWNVSAMMQEFLNDFDYTGLFDRTMTNIDTNHILSLVVTDFDTWYANLFPNSTTEVPDNVLILWAFETMDGTKSDLDSMTLRFDMDHDGVYEATDYSYVVEGNDADYYIQGWTQRPAGVWYGSMTCAYLHDDDAISDVFRDSGYNTWMAYISLDAMYVNGAHYGANDVIGLSIDFFDSGSNRTVIWQDYWQPNETTKANIFGTPASDNPDLENTSYTNATNWGHFLIDTTITGEALADPVDPSVTTGPHALRNMPGTLGLLGYLLSIVIIIGFLIGIWGYMTSVKRIGINEVKTTLIMVLIMVVILAITLSFI
jgi:hypothetical protein